MILERINDTSTVRELSLKEMKILAEEIREGILFKTSKCGGHVAPNLGIVELTIAIHHVFNFPKDKIVFDTSHQTYAHKMITGRKNAFLIEDQFKTVTGFTNPAESNTDLFSLGHTSTSIGLATGLAIQRDYNNSDENIIAVIGDSSLDGGPALEALNYLGSLNTGFILIVNDNNQSIAENYGVLCNELNKLDKNNGNLDNNIFSDFGFEYHFVKDGHSIEDLVNVLNTIKDCKKKILLHVRTIKGKGYLPAETNKEQWHATRPFDIKTGLISSGTTKENYGSIFRDYCIKKVATDNKVVFVTAAMPYVVGFNCEEYRKELLDKYIDVGIAEQNAILTCAGIAKAGGKPIFATVASFYQRAYDEIIQEICVNSLPVTMIVTHASVYGINDETHFGLYDIYLLGNVPGLTYLAPTNKEEYIAMLEWSTTQRKEPVAIRVPWMGVCYANGSVCQNYSIKKYSIIKSGSRVAIIALGSFFEIGRKCWDILFEKYKINATLINPLFISHVDELCLENLKENHDIVITLEDGIKNGGFGSKISQYYSCSKMLVKNYGFDVPIPNLYNPEALMKKNRIVPDLIVEDIISLLNY